MVKKTCIFKTRVSSLLILYRITTFLKIEILLEVLNDERDIENQGFSMSFRSF
jgi:hypothetical protein